MPTGNTSPSRGIPSRHAWSSAIVAVLCGALTALIGGLALAGWAFDIPVLRSAAPGWAEVQPLSAVAFVLAGTALVLQVSKFSRLQLAAAAIVALIGGSALVQYLSGLPLPGVDHLLFPEAVARQPMSFPGRMAEITAIEFLLSATSLILCRWPRTAPTCATLASAGLLIACIGGVGYLMGAHRLARMGSYSAMAAYSTLAFAILFIGCLASRYERTWLRDVLSSRSGGTMARRLLPVVVLFPLAVGMVVDQVGAGADLPATFQLALAMVAIMTGLAAATVWVARRLSYAERRAQAAGLAVGRAEARLRAVVDTAVDAMVVIDDSGIIQSFNKAAARIFGYAEQEAIGRNISFLMPEPHRSRHDAYIEVYKRTGTAKIIGSGRELIGLRRDGTQVPLDISIAEWWDDGRRFFTGIMRDITLRKQAEERLTASEANFRTIYEQAGVGIKLVGLDGRLLDVNQKLCEFLGFSREDLLNLTFEDITEPVDLIAENRLLAEMLDGRRTSYVIEKRFTRKHGRVVWGRVTSSLQKSADGVTRSRISIVEDITAQKEAVRALQAAKDQAEAAMQATAETALRFEAVADNIPQLAWMTRPDGEIFWYNKRWYDYTGATVEQTQGWRWLSVLHPDHMDRVVASARHSLETGTPWEETFPLRGRDGQFRWFLSRALPVRDDAGKVVLWFGTNTDVTEQRAQEAALQQAKEGAERANRDKSRFLAAASHDLRQPVQALLLFSSALVERLRDQPAAQKVMDSMQASLDALQTLLGGLLDVSRLDAGVIIPEIRPFPLGDLIRRIGGEYQPRASEKGLDLRFVCAERRVASDPVLLERILRNLVENALRYTERGRILIGCRRSGPHVLLQVADTGVGIAPGQQEAVFQEFYQIGNPERDSAQGLGLGLSIIRRLCHLLDHRLSLSSQPGRGTCFSLHLPLAEEPAPALTAQPPSEPAGRQVTAGRVLIIDDEAMIRAGLTMLLEGWGWKVTATADGDEAIEWARHSGLCPDVILADYRLRDGHVGTDAVHRVRRECGHEIPAVIITGDTSPERLAEIKGSGFDVAHKPLTATDLRELLLQT